MKKQFLLLSVFYFLFCLPIIGQQKKEARTFTSEEIRELVCTYQNLGLFNHLSKSELATAKKKVANQKITCHQDVLLCFPKVIVFFDWETNNLKNPYEELILQFSAASRGLFDPQNIVDTYGENQHKVKTTFAFEWNNTYYEKSFTMMGKALSPRFLFLIEDALQAARLNARLYDCYSDGDSVGYIFLSNTQYAYLRTHQKSLFQRK